MRRTYTKRETRAPYLDVNTRTAVLGTQTLVCGRTTYYQYLLSVLRAHSLAAGPSENRRASDAPDLRLCSVTAHSQFASVPWSTSQLALQPRFIAADV